jgi:uncharacterized membrane protein
VEDVALFFHLLGAFSLIGGTIVAGVAFETARRRVVPAEIALLLGVTRIGVVLVVLGAVMVLGFGLWLVDLGDWGYGAGWVDAALGLFAAAVVMGGIGGQRPKRARKLAQRLAAERTPANAELRALLDDPATRVVNYLSALLLLAVLMLMVFKPGAHNPESSGAPPDGSSSHPPRVRARQAAAAHVDEHADRSLRGIAGRIGDREHAGSGSSPEPMARPT